MFNCTNLKKVYRIQKMGQQLLVHAYGVSFGILEWFTEKDFLMLEEGYMDVYVDISGKKSKLVWMK